MSETTQYRYWLERLKQIHKPATPIVSAGDDGLENTEECVGHASAKSAKTGNTDPLDDARLNASDPEVAWRVEALRPYVRPYGPIWLPPVRPNVPLLRDAPDHCASCGDPKPPAQRYHCLPCQHAQWLVLSEQREDVEIVPTHHESRG